LHHPQSELRRAVQPWKNIQRGHKSEDQRDAEIRAAYESADAAVIHIVKQLQAKGNPDLKKIGTFLNQKNVRGWRHDSRLAFRDPISQTPLDRRHWRITIEQTGSLWGIEAHSPPGHDYDGRWGHYASRSYNGSRFVFPFDNDPTGRLVGAYTVALVPFQLLVVEMVEKYKLALPPD
jgi:hypothetical protein